MDFDIVLKECVIKTSRASGKGGQHVNKVSTRVELFFDVLHSSAFSEEEKSLLLNKLASKISNEKVLHLYDDSSRFQSRNKKTLIEKLQKLIIKSLQKRKKRISTKPSKKAKENRLKEKKIVSIKKEHRKKPF